MKDAMELYRSIRKDSTDAEKLEVCKAIMEASGDRAFAIYYAKSYGWWKDDVAEPCQAIMEAPGNCAFAISWAKSKGWWNDEVAEPCQAILEAPGDRASAISLAKSNNWWKDEVAEPCQAIMEAPGNRAYAISRAKSKGWWNDEVAEPCQAILEAPGDRAYAISFAKSRGWWKDEVAEPCQAIMEAPGDRAYAISLAKSDGWWKDPQPMCNQTIEKLLKMVNDPECPDNKFLLNFITEYKQKLSTVDLMTQVTQHIIQEAKFAESRHVIFLNGFIAKSIEELAKSGNWTQLADIAEHAFSSATNIIKRNDDAITDCIGDIFDVKQKIIKGYIAGKFLISGEFDEALRLYTERTSKSEK